MIKIIDDYDAVKKAINDMPTTYDVDKVVEQLEKKIQTHECCIEYEKKNGQRFYEIIQLSLEPAFKEWKEEIGQRLRPYVVS